MTELVCGHLIAVDVMQMIGGSTHRTDDQHPKPNPLAELPDSKGWTPLHYACYDNNMKLVQQLINAGADPNARYDFNILCFTKLWAVEVVNLNGIHSQGGACKHASRLLLSSIIAAINFVTILRKGLCLFLCSLFFFTGY